MLELYSYTSIEEWIETFYKKNGFLSPEDLDIHAIADTLGVFIRETRGPDRAIWDDDYNMAIIFLNKLHPTHIKREIFFHELCHPIRHSGSQEMMFSDDFLNLQEVQANQFQLYSALPFFMISEFYDSKSNGRIEELAQAFNISRELVRARLEQIKLKISGRKLNQQFTEKIHEQPAPNSNKFVSEKPVPSHAKSLVEQALLQQKKESRQ